MLEGRKIIVTGGFSGIGAATVDVIRRRGGQAFIIDAGASQLIDPTDFSQADVTDFPAIERAVAEASQRMSGIDGLVNAAGVTGGRSLGDTDMAQWDRVFAVNLTGTLNVARAALPFLREAQDASIVNVSSGVALSPFPGLGAYAASKRAVLSLSQTWAMELAPGIRVNVVCPGAVDTPMLQNANRSKTTNQLDGALYALKRIARPEEIATAIAFLLGSDASYVTGAILPVDGGRTYY
jgi:NAD(P)-dependent dehydrogenase (short-subunit alcohol dehydrogenase family)